MRSSNLKKIRVEISIPTLRSAPSQNIYFLENKDRDFDSKVRDSEDNSNSGGDKNWDRSDEDDQDHIILWL